MTTEPARTRRTLRFAVIVLLLIAALGFLLLSPKVYLLVVAHLSAIPAIAYPLVYRGSPWRSGATGKALMNMARAVALLYAVGLLGMWWPLPGYDYIYAAVVTYLGVAITYQFTRMLQLKRLAQRIHPDVRSTLLRERNPYEATEAVRPDDTRREDRRLADEGRAAQG